MSIQKTCCVAGHRDIPMQKLEELRELLKQEIAHAIANGYTHFISSCTEKVDIMFAELVLELRDNGSAITMEANIPYRDYLKNPCPEFQAVIAKCNAIHSAKYIVLEEYQRSSLLSCNRDMVQKSSLIIAVYDGRQRGGTAYTICYARAMRRKVLVIAP